MNIENEPKFFEKLVFNTASYLMPKSVITSFQTDKIEFKKVYPKFSYLAAFVENQDKDLDQILTDDFYGGVPDKSIEIKKLKTLEIYRYFYRFSFEKLVIIINNPLFLIMFLQYLKSDKMKRIHSRPVFQRNLKNYYRALENLINNNEMKTQILELI